MTQSLRARLRSEASRAARALRKLSRIARRVDDRALVQRYLQQTGAPKLHLGCGDNVLSGWLNVDFVPQRDEIVKMDATKPFPLPAGAFGFVFTEHFIEHFGYPEGEQILRECFRVLRPGGIIRVSTPDIAFLVRLLGESKSELERRYVDWSCRAVVDWAPYADPTFVVNHFVRSWGHTFVYSKPVLRDLLARVGFGSISECALNQSTSPELSGLENETRLPEGFLRLETFTLEAQKPGAS